MFTAAVSRSDSMRVAIFWTGVTATMTAAYRAFAALPGVELRVFVELPAHPDTAYDAAALLAGLDSVVLRADEPLDSASLIESVATFRPDVMIVLGWRSEMCRAAAESAALAAVPKLLAFDLQFAYTLRKLLAPIVLRRYLRRFAGAFVPGERSAEYARWLGFPDGAVTRGITGVDTAPFARAAAARAATPAYPRRFLYVGRYAREKGLDLLLEAYRRYRRGVADPWTLTCCGMGPEAARLVGVEGVEDRGFVQPPELPAVYGEHGAFVLASRYEPWGFVIQEAAAAGLPIVCTAACGAHVELVRDGINGRVCRPGDVIGFADALRWIHDREQELAEIGSLGQTLVEPYSTANWAARLLGVCKALSRSAAS